MKKIHNIHDLRQEQEILEQRKLQLEKELHRDWNDVKRDLSGQGNSFPVSLKHKYPPGLLYKALSLGTGLLASKFGGKIGGKIYSWFK
jgi:hypothetical protein